MMFDKDAIINELEFKAIRSSGSGGQHVNKTSSKVELQWRLGKSTTITDEQKVQLREYFSNRLTSDARLILQCGETRSQHKNKEIVIGRFLNMLVDGLKEKKVRKKSRIPRAVKQKRLVRKRMISEKKASRKPPNLE